MTKDTKRRYTVLGFGEKYMAPAEKKKGMPLGDTSKGRSLAEVRAKLAPKITSMLTSVEKMPKDQRLDEVVVELRLDEKFLAKSYNPDDLLKQTGLTLRGTGSWTQYSEPRKRGKDKAAPSEPEAVQSRSLYVSGGVDSLRLLRTAVVRGLSEDVDADILKLEDIRLPSAEDRLRLQADDATAAALAVEVVLFAWDDQRRKQAVDRVLKVLDFFRVAESKRRVKVYEKGPTFIAAVAPAAAIEQLGTLNFLRSARPLPRVHLTKTVTRRTIPFAKAPLKVALPEARIAIFDGGYAQGHPLLDPYVESIDLTTGPESPDDVEHGTMVASAAVFGPMDDTGALPAPACRVLSYRVLPDPLNDDLELYGVIDAIEKQVPLLPKDVKVINLSIGPRGPIDDVPSRFTYALDRMARDNAKLFVTAVGNDGTKLGYERVQAPADSVNNLGVGAFRLDSKDAAEHARYSSQGPGRWGCVVKPDLVAFGGCRARPFMALTPTVGEIGGTTGTSFAAPLVSAVAGQMHALIEPPGKVGPEALRALLLHSSVPMSKFPKSHVGHGRAAATPDEVLECSPRRVSILYEGMVSPRESWKLPFLLPPDFEPGGTVHFEWTIAFSPEINFPSPDEYTQAGLDVAFRPHSDIFYFNPPRGDDSSPPVPPMKVNVQAEVARVIKLRNAGWTQSPVPVADSQKGKSERLLRAAAGKWETVLRDRRGKRPNSISAPMLTVGVLGRGSWDKKDPNLRARFAAVLTVDAPKFDGDLYQQVLANFNLVQPLKLRQQSTSRVRLR
ncbi:S8 family peptidase [Corallococcus coralloides]|uniref:S8 family peptidase n=1 Tax=Corallococcus coralloides TaxID=184914 RepID=UPI00384E3EAA